MTLYEKILHGIDTADEKRLIEALGYRTHAKGRKALAAFGRSGGLYPWVKSGYFDMVHTAESLLTALAEVLHLPKEEVERAVAEAKAREARIRDMAAPYIFVDTGFKRANEPILALAALEPKRRIRLEKEALADEPLPETLERVAGIVRDHYARTKGELPIWGKIRGYRYHHTDGTVWNIGTDGSVTPLPSDTDDGPQAILSLP